jgi:hypothetical protein
MGILFTAFTANCFRELLHSHLHRAQLLGFCAQVIGGERGDYKNAQLIHLNTYLLVSSWVTD